MRVIAFRRFPIFVLFVSSLFAIRLLLGGVYRILRRYIGFAVSAFGFVIIVLGVRELNFYQWCYQPRSFPPPSQVPLLTSCTPTHTNPSTNNSHSFTSNTAILPH